jgi:hypothetical protein
MKHFSAFFQVSFYFAIVVVEDRFNGDFGFDKLPAKEEMTRCDDAMRSSISSRSSKFSSADWTLCTEPVRA